uniref:NCK-associated protein 5-like n=1 Tax=Kryptolebias marmoratus TaxID=37003 RepID=A0A3Q3B1J4_KRYMA
MTESVLVVLFFVILQAENSALVLANESQREAYERCLDEVANHVVQALLNQKDLREECIKLKMLVFDLERQNRALCELFQQKLPSQPTPHYQELDCSIFQVSTLNGVLIIISFFPKGNGYHTQHSSPGPRGPAASMEALSPFLKKKAHILEVLRKMEETDPLKFHPSTTSLSFCDYSQVLMSTEAVLATAEPIPLQCKSHHTHCHCSCSNTDTHQQVNGDGGVKCEAGITSCLHCKKSPGSPPKPCSHICSPLKANSSTQSHVPAAAMSEGHNKTRAGESIPPPTQCNITEANQQPASSSSHSVVTKTVHQSLEAVGAGQADSESPLKAGVSEELTGFCASSHPPISVKESAQTSQRDMATSDGVHNGLAHSSSTMLSDPPTILDEDSADQEDSSVRASASVSPSPSCLSDVKTAAINSPSKLLKFLKIPTIGEKSQASTSAVRLSPQLTRNSRIPCRTNNYEVYHSPVPTRRATTTERCRQPPPPPSRSESYPATHSAPTSPPQPEDTCSPPTKEKSYNSLSAPKTSAGSKLGPPSGASLCPPKVSQMVPHYENVLDMSNSREEERSQGLEKRSTISTQAKANGGERKLVKSLPESVLNPSPERNQSSSLTSESTSDDEEDSDSPVWVNHHSLPNSAALNKTQSKANYSRTRDKPETDVRDVSASGCEVSQPPPPVQKSDSSSIPKRPTSGAGRSQADSSHHAFKDRLAALGKLRSSEDLQVGLRPVNPANESTHGEEKTKTAERSTEIHKEEQRHSKFTDSLDGKPKSINIGLKYPGSSQLYEQTVKLPSSGPAAVKQELCVAKPEASKSKIGLPSPNADAPQVLRSNIKCPGSLNLAYNVKASAGAQSSNSPNKIPPKSPSKPLPSVHRGGKPSEGPRYSSKSEERTKISGKGKKNPMYGDSLPPPPPRPPVSEGKKSFQPAPSLQSAIEQKVMKGIEENVLKLQEQDKGGQGSEVKQKASNGIASWFGLKKSKLPALSRKTEASKAKDEKKEWKINIPSVGRDSVKMATRCKEGVEGLNISTLMEKAEGLRRALEEERAYVERSGRGHSCEVVMDQAQGQLAVMYRGARSGASTYTLDSGIGTFPLPDCSSGATGRGPSKTRAGAEHHSTDSPGRAGRRARTLDRELPSQEECFASHKQLIPSIQYCSVLEGRSSAGVIHEGISIRTNMKAGGPSSSRMVDPGSLPVPAQTGLSRRGKMRTPSVPEMSREAGLELLRERPEEALSPSRPQVLETPESLSDSLYDSLSSCGSQG